MVKSLLIAGVAVAVGVIAGEMIDAKLGPMIEGEKEPKRTTVRRGVKIAIQTTLAIVIFGLASKVV